MAQGAERGGGEPVFEVAGNRLTPLAFGPDRLDSLIALIDGARTSLRILYYIYADDSAGRRVRASLDRALQRGVTVALIVDGFGAEVGEGFFASLEGAGADVCRFLPRFGRRYLLRNHQKLALADERRAIIGGFNVQNDYFGLIEDGAWRDLGLIVEGPAAEQLTGYFDALKAWSHTPRAPMRDLRRALRAWSEQRGAVRWLLGGPMRRLSPWALSMKHDLSRATRLEMIAAYFAPNPAMLRRIEAVARRGAARVMTASKSDNNATIAAARHCYARLLRRGVEVYEYLPTKLHTKLYVVDDVVYVGSANFDMRSLFINLEMMLRIEDPAFAAHMRGYFDGEAVQSRQISREGHRRQGVLARVQWALAYFVVAVMDANVTRRLNFGIGAQ